jgi:hypothetical protein
MTARKSSESSPTQSGGTDWRLIAFVSIAIAALLGPHISLTFIGVYWSAALSVAIFAVWFSVMQTTCINGGMICSLFAMAILLNTIGLVFLAVVRLIVTLFT